MKGDAYSMMVHILNAKSLGNVVQTKYKPTHCTELYIY